MGNCDGCYDQMSVGNSLKHYLWWQKRNSLALAVGCKRMLPRTRIITNNGSESLFVAQKKKKYGASMRLVSRESEYGSLCSGVPSSPSPKSRYKVVLWFWVWRISLTLSYAILHQDHSVVESLITHYTSLWFIYSVVLFFDAQKVLRMKR